MENNKRKLVTGATLAGLALAFSSLSYAQEGGSAPAAQAPAQGECHGVNSCKGSGECAGKSNACTGKNSCKGKGWMKMSKEDCTAKKGTFKVAKKM